MTDFRMHVVSTPTIEIVSVHGRLSNEKSPRLAFLLDALLRRGKPVVVDLSAATCLNPAVVSALTTACGPASSRVGQHVGVTPSTITSSGQAWRLLVRLDPTNGPSSGSTAGWPRPT